MDVRITASLRAEASKAQRLKLQAGTASSGVGEIIAHLALLSAYDMTGPGATLVDLNGQPMRVVSCREGDHPLVYESDKTEPVYVFAQVQADRIAYLGWMTNEEVQEIPLTIAPGQADNYRTVEPPYLAAMPEKFDFSPTCNHGAGVWDDLYGAWECVCGRVIHSEADRRLVARSLHPTAQNRT